MPWVLKHIASQKVSENVRNGIRACLDFQKSPPWEDAPGPAYWVELSTHN